MHSGSSIPAGTSFRSRRTLTCRRTALPDYVDVDFIDENLESINYDDPVDFVGISMMLANQVKRGWEMAL